MASYDAVITKDAEKELRTVPFPFRRQINIGLNKLKKDPRPKLCERIDEGENYRLRISGWRVVYVIDDEASTITIVAIMKDERV